MQVPSAATTRNTISASAEASAIRTGGCPTVCSINLLPVAKETNHRIRISISTTLFSPFSSQDRPLITTVRTFRYSSHHTRILIIGMTFHMTAAATTLPASGPRPASSVPASSPSMTGNSSCNVIFIIVLCFSRFGAAQACRNQGSSQRDRIITKNNFLKILNVRAEPAAKNKTGCHRRR